MVKPNHYSTNGTDVAITLATSSGSTTNGCLSVTFYNKGVAAGTLAGVVLPAGEGWEFEGNGPYNAIAYDATGTTFEIVEETE